VASPVTMPSFVSHLANLMGRYRAYEHRQSLMIPNEYMLSNRGVYPQAAYDFSNQGTDLSQAPDPVREALFSILKAGGGFFRG